MSEAANIQENVVGNCLCSGLDLGVDVWKALATGRLVSKTRSIRYSDEQLPAGSGWGSDLHQLAMSRCSPPKAIMQRPVELSVTSKDGEERSLQSSMVRAR